MCRALRENERFNRVPILFITAYADPTSLQKTADAGAQGLIEKPIMFGELLTQVIEALAGRFSVPTRIKFA
jgi:CheY-like chemotaxis protein